MVHPLDAPTPLTAILTVLLATSATAHAEAAPSTWGWLQPGHEDAPAAFLLAPLPAHDADPQGAMDALHEHAYRCLRLDAADLPHVEAHAEAPLEIASHAAEPGLWVPLEHLALALALLGLPAGAFFVGRRHGRPPPSSQEEVLRLLKALHERHALQRLHDCPWCECEPPLARR